MSLALCVLYTSFILFSFYLFTSFSLHVFMKKKKFFIERIEPFSNHGMIRLDFILKLTFLIHVCYQFFNALKTESKVDMIKQFLSFFFFLVLDCIKYGGLKSLPGRTFIGRIFSDLKRF